MDAVIGISKIKNSAFFLAGSIEIIDVHAH
jgi:hypothetical protein